MRAGKRTMTAIVTVLAVGRQEGEGELNWPRAFVIFPVALLPALLLFTVFDRGVERQEWLLLASSLGLNVWWS
jgi:hypothetical protein